MENEPLIRWPQPILELLSFVTTFLAIGAFGFRAIVMPRAVGAHPAGEERAALDRAASRAAVLGLSGAVVTLILLLWRLPQFAARSHVATSWLATHDPQTIVQLALALAAVAGFALALGRGWFGWTLSGVGVVAGALRPAFFGQWPRLVNPVHELAGGMWIGTLFVLVTAGLSAVLRSELASDRRGAVAASLVNAFSPLALSSAFVLAVFGVITAWRHLHRLEALWTTPYGYALIAKLGLVLGVVALGAWNWRRQRPRLGGEDAALSLRGSARAELAVAALVLVITSVLVSLPSPRESSGSKGPAAAGMR